MSADIVRETLKNEADLLGQMIKFVNSVKTEGFTRQAALIHGSWARFLGERKASNDHLSTVGDEELPRDLEQELCQVQQYIDVTRTHPA